MPQGLGHEFLEHGESSPWRGGHGSWHKLAHKPLGDDLGIFDVRNVIAIRKTSGIARQTAERKLMFE